jgi:hypothetical protein
LPSAEQKQAKQKQIDTRPTEKCFLLFHFDDIWYLWMTVKKAIFRENHFTLGRKDQTVLYRGVPGRS